MGGPQYNREYTVGGLLHLVHGEGPGRRAAALPSPLLAVPNVTAHPLAANEPTSYYSMWNSKGLITNI